MDTAPLAFILIQLLVNSKQKEALNLRDHLNGNSELLKLKPIREKLAEKREYERQRRFEILEKWGILTTLFLTAASAIFSGWATLEASTQAEYAKENLFSEKLNDAFSSYIQAVTNLCSAEYAESPNYTVEYRLTPDKKLSLTAYLTEIKSIYE